jgi:hypothetical protein
LALRGRACRSDFAKSVAKRNAFTRAGHAGADMHERRATGDVKHRSVRLPATADRMAHRRTASLVPPRLARQTPRTGRRVGEKGLSIFDHSAEAARDKHRHLTIINLKIRSIPWDNTWKQAWPMLLVATR